MKKYFLSALVSIAITVTSFAAEGNKVSLGVLNNFAYHFKHASDVTWTSEENYAKATFKWNNISTEAVYTPEGDFIGSMQAITLEELPVNAKRKFAKKYEGYTVKEAIRFEGSKEKAYYVSAEDGKGSVILKVEDDGSMSKVGK